MPDIKFSNKYPYTDFHELNLDWIIKEVKFWSERVGKSIQKIEKTGTVGLVDTYTITYSDSSTSTFDVTNGNGIASVAKTGTVGLVDTYTITFQDGSTTTFEVTNGTAAIDPTLTLSDYAADAKATGNAIDDLKDIIKDLTSIEIPIEFGPTGNQYIALNMAIGQTVSLTPTTSDYNYWRYAIIDCNPGDEFILNIVGGSTPRAYGFIDSDNKLLAVAPYGAFSGTILAPADAAKLILNDNSGGTVYYITPAGRVDNLENAVADLENRSIDIVTGNNIYDSSKNVYGKMFLETGPSVDIVENEYTIDYTSVVIPVNSEYITFSCENVHTRLYNWFAVSSDIFPANYISMGQPGQYIYSGYTIQIPSGTNFICCSFQNLSGSDHMMVNAGQTAMAYEEYTVSYYIDGAKIQIDTSGGIEYIKCPDTYNLVVGDTFQLFWKGIINAVKPELYEIVGRCSSGRSFSEFFEITPSATGNLTLTIEIYDRNHEYLESKDVTLIVNSRASSPLTIKNVLCVGDSLTVDGVWPKELYRRLTANDGTPTGDGLSNINFIGTREVDGVHFEGYGGWSFNSYNTENVSDTSKLITATHDKTSADQHSIYQASNGSTWKLETIEAGTIKIMLVNGNPATFPVSGSLTWISGGINHNNIVYTNSENSAGNPFWNDNTNEVDFANYASEQNVSQIDFVYVLLGWNSTWVNLNTYKTQVQTFIDNVQDAFPAAKIVLMGLEIPSASGLAVNYGATGDDSNYYLMQQFVFRIDQLYEEIAAENVNVSVINVSGQFDTIHNMQTGTRQVNTRNSTTETYQTNGVHPATSGYLQIADAVYRDITAKL